jgi:iron complex outermembrane receptor protein
MNRRLSTLTAISLFLAPCAAHSQESLPDIDVGSAPLRVRSKPTPSAASSAQPSSAQPTPTALQPTVPSSVQITTAKELGDSRQFDLGPALNRTTPGVSLLDVTGNPFAPELDYRGFVASPVAGTPQGLAVYQNGVRINEAWGDSVNWDLIPTVAIDRSTIVTGNPLFGLNAIGGAVVLDMKNGFTWQGFEVDARVGSYNRRQSTMQYGVQDHDFAAYLAVEAIGDRGYRQFSGAYLHRLYGDIGYRGEQAEIHATLSLAQNRFGVSGPAPLDLVNNDTSAVYTTPQTTKNTLAQYGINATFTPSATWKLLADIHYRAFDQAHVDGNVTEFEPCGEEFLCNEEDEETHVPDLFGGKAALGVIDRTWTRSRTIGGTVQANNVDKILGFPNRLTFGVSYDHGWTAFAANEELGVVGPDLAVTGNKIIVEEPEEGVSSVSVRASNNYLGVYALDSLDVTDSLTITAGARFNHAKIALYDLRGTSLNGNANFSRVNPVAGLTYKVLPNLLAYASYSEANRAPTPLELGCADPNRPCLIDNFLVADPPLKQVVSQTIETGLRGNFQLLDYLPGRFQWNAGLFRTHNFDDILSVPSAIMGRGYFVNAGTTLRQGVEAALRYRDERLSAFVSYTLTDATFRSAITLGAPDNPLAAAFGEGTIRVTPGAHLSSVPRHRLKAGADFAVTPEWRVGGDLVYNAGLWLRGDEINAFGTLSPHATINLRTSYQFSPNLQFYGLVENVGNVRPRNFGTFFETDAISFLPLLDPRMVSIGRPIGVYGGAKLTF